MPIPTCYAAAIKNRHFDFVAGTTNGDTINSTNTSYLDSDFSDFSLGYRRVGEFKLELPAKTSFTTHFYWYNNGAGYTDFTWYGDTAWTDPIVRIRAEDTTDLVEVYHYPSGVSTLLGTFDRTSGPDLNIDTHIEVNGSTGSIKVQVGQVTLFNQTNIDTTGSASTDCQGFGFVRQSGSTGYSYISELSFWDGDISGPRLYTRCQPNAIGNYADFTGTFADVSEQAVVESTTVNASATGGERVTYGTAADLTNLNAAYDDYFIAGAILVGFAQREASGPTGFQWLIRNGVTDDNSATESLSVGFLPFSNIYNTDPTDAGAWTRADIDAIEIGIQSIT